MKNMNDLSKTFDLLLYLDDVGIRYWESGENVGRDYIGIQCVFCSDHFNHLGIHRRHKGFRCLICDASGSLVSLLKELEHTESNGHIREVLKKYQDYWSPLDAEPPKKKKKQSDIFPVGFERIRPKKLPPLVSKFLKEKNFKPSIIKQYSIGWCKMGDYPLSLIIPIFYNHKMVSFMAMDLTGKASPKYQICPNHIALMNKDNLVYGLDELDKDTDRIYICEGITDKWRLGRDAIALLGKRFTASKLHSISTRTTSDTIAIVILDEDAKEKAEELSVNLSVYFSDIRIVLLSRSEDNASDPEELSKKQIKYIRSI